MATNPNDIQLRIQAAVDGLQDIGKLLGELDDLGADTTAASADVEQLNEAMSSLGQQRKLIDALEQTRGKVDEAKGAMDEAVAEADRLKAAYDASAAGVDAQRRAAQQAAASAEQAGEAYQQQRRDLQALQTQYKGVQAETVGARQAWRDAAQRVRDLEAAIDASGEATDEQARQLEQARGAADEARRSYQRQADSLSGIRDRLQEQRQSVDQAKTAWEGYRDESKGLNRDLKDSERAFARQERELGRAQQAADKARTSFERQGQALDELSQDAKRAGVDVDNLADEQQRLERESEQLAGSVDQLKDRLRQYRQEADTTGSVMGKLTQRLKGGAAAFTAWAGAAAAGGAALAVGVISRYTAAQADLAAQTQNTAEALGLNAERLQEYQYAFERVGIQSDKTGDLMKDVADKIGDAYTNGGGEAKDAIDALGLSIDELIQLSPDEMLLRIASAMESLPKASQVNILESLGDDAALLQPLLENNAARLRELAAEARNVGAIYTEEDLERLRRTDEAVDRLSDRFQGLRNRLMVKLAPAVTEVADQLDHLLEDNPGLVQDLATAFGGLLRQTRDWMQYIVTNREKVGGALQSLIDTAQFLGNTFTAVFRGIQMVIAGVLSGAAQAYAHVRNLMESTAGLLNKLGIVSDETLARMRAHSEAAQQAVRDLEAQTVEYGRQALQAGADAVNAFDNSADAAGRAGEAAGAAAEQQAQVSAAAIQSARQIAAAAETNAAAQAALREQLAAARAEHEALREELGKNPSDVLAQKAGQAANEVARLERELRGAERAGRDNAKAMEAAAKALGLTVEELSTGVSAGANEAIASFETLVRAGELSGEQLQQAFQATWNSLDSPEARQAFLDNLQAMVDEGVEGAAQWLAAWRESFAGLEKSSAGAVDAVKQVGDAAAEAAEKQEKQNKATEKARSVTTTWKQVLDNANNSMRAVISNTAQGISWRRKYRKQMIEWAQSEAAAADATDEGTDALDRQTQAMERAESASSSLNDSLADSVASMREQLAQLEGDQERVQELQYDRQRLQLQDQLNQAREAGDAEAQRSAREALRLADEIHRKRLDNIRAEARERDRQSAAATTGPATAPAAPAAQPAQPTRATRIELVTPKGTARLTADSNSDEQILLDALGRDARRTY